VVDPPRWRIQSPLGEPWKGKPGMFQPPFPARYIAESERRAMTSGKENFDSKTAVRFEWVHFNPQKEDWIMIVKSPKKTREHQEIVLGTCFWPQYWL
jgi:hypothetical protein